MKQQRNKCSPEISVFVAEISYIIHSSLNIMFSRFSKCAKKAPPVPEWRFLSFI
jgi:hypothetical protein